MGTVNYKNLLSYKVMLECGDQEIIDKVNALIETYEKAVATGDTKHWSYWETDFDDEQPNRALKASWSYNSPEYFMQLDLVTDFTTDLKAYRNRSVNGQFEIVKYFEQKERSYSFNPNIICLNVVPEEQWQKAKVVTKKGSIFSGTKEIKTADLGSSMEDSSENA